MIVAGVHKVNNAKRYMEKLREKIAAEMKEKIVAEMKAKKQ